MSITLKQLIKLYILQKNAHLYSNDLSLGFSAIKEYEHEYKKLMADVEYESSDMMASFLFENQPDIPFVLFKPKSATEQQPAPLIIHTHGGPNVYMDKKKFHAEIAYFISHGFVVACPNYRGSTGYPDIGEDPEEWKKWETMSRDKHHIYGPQDVFTVTKFVQKMPYIAKEKIYLRGGSFGSFINAHLLAEIKKGTYESIFKGAHLSGGVKYPIPSSMPEDIPLLITHSIKDSIAPFSDARIFMEKMLQKQLSFELEGVVLDNIQTFVSHSGDHHLIDPELQLEEGGSSAYMELVTYLQYTTEFIDALVHERKYQLIDSYDQFKLVMTDKDSEADPASEVLQRVYSYQQTRLSAQKRVLENNIFSSKSSLNGCLTQDRTYGPTCSLLKLQLRKHFTGHIKTDLTTYLQNHFTPVNWSVDRNRLTEAGNTILSDETFVEQMVQVIENEERLLRQYPDHMVMYHTAEPNSLQLYTFINLWLEILRNQPIHELPVIKELRLYDFMKNTFDDVKVFLLKMRQLRISEEVVFNNIPGFPERAIACNPALISNSHSTASSSFWWYFNAKENDRAPIETIIKDMLKMLGIYSQERMDRYLQLFGKEKERLDKSPQALLQQILVPYSIAEKSVYVCQIWGEEFKSNNINLASPKIIRELINDPILFEQKLRKNQQAFTNFDECDDFGDIKHGFNYSNFLQLRYLPRNNKEIITYSYFRSLNAHQQFVTALSQLIREDYADFLAYGSTLPDFVLQDAEATKQTLMSQTRLGIFNPKKRLNLYAFEVQQQELYKGLVQNPNKELYGGIIELTQENKAKLQERLRAVNGKESSHSVFTFSLCLYLKGYTYYDLLKEASAAVFLNDKLLPQYRKNAEETVKFIMEMVDLFSIPSAIKNVAISSANYHKLYDLLRGRAHKYEYNPQKHQFIQPAGRHHYYEDYLFGLELTSAINSVLMHARLAKKFGYGDDVDSAMERIYSA